jgi:hypothetical protein
VPYQAKRWVWSSVPAPFVRFVVRRIPARIVTVVERASRFTLLCHLPEGRHTAEAVRDALATAFDGFPAHLRCSLTWDQGSEMALHAQIAQVLGMPVFSATRPAHGSGPPTRTPTGCCASTFPNTPTCVCMMPRASPRSPRSEVAAEL